MCEIVTDASTSVMAMLGKKIIRTLCIHQQPFDAIGLLVVSFLFIVSLIPPFLSILTFIKYSILLSEGF